MQKTNFTTPAGLAYSSAVPQPGISPPPLAFSSQESRQAYARWLANCGPHALAAACGKSLDQVHEVLPDFRGWMSPQHIEKALENLGFSWEIEEEPSQPKNGILRIQWHGPWLGPNHPPEAAWAHTHWIACQNGHIYDTIFRSWQGWIPLQAWQRGIKFFAEIQYGGWHFTHLYQIFERGMAQTSTHP